MKFSFSKKKEPTGNDILERGWQFYRNPTTLEPPGTVFRIDPNGHRFLVNKLEVKISAGQELASQIEFAVETKIGVLARLLDLPPLSAKVGGKRIKQIIFVAEGLVRETTMDSQLMTVVNPFLGNLDYRVDNRYFMLREARSATAMTLKLTEEILGELGGKTKVSAALSAGATLSGAKRNTYQIETAFPQRMRIMFLPEEIKPISAGLAGEPPELGLVKVNEVLEWQELGDHGLPPHTLG